MLSGHKVLHDGLVFDIHEVEQSALDVTIPAGNVFLHTIIQHYYVDGQEGVSSPLGMIGRKLEAFTGMRWIVMVAKDGGDKPVARQRQEAKDNLFMTAREHPDVQAVLKRFPGAEIIDVKLPDDSLPPPNMSESDEEPR